MTMRAETADTSTRRLEREVALLAVTVAVILLVVPLAVGAQPAGRVPRIGVLATVNPRTAAFHRAFDDELRKLGYREGENVAVEFLSAQGEVERLPDLAAELVRTKVNVIVAGGPDASLRAIRQATTTIPIVMVAVDYDPVALGHVASLARPGGNVTGVFLQTPELTAKRLELLKEVLPRVSRVAVLWDPFSADQLREAEKAARALGIRLQPLEVRNLPHDLEHAFQVAVQQRAGGLLLLASPLFFRERARLAELALRHRLPLSTTRLVAEAGALMGYGTNASTGYRRAAHYVDRILRGARPADLPIEQPTEFELVLNVRTAKALGLTIPPSVLIRANHVIE
jgi:putative tryptophan/tyrosine transport system substrate-binding protein